MNRLTDEQIETLSYQDMAKILLEGKKGGKTTVEIFEKICKRLKMSDEEMKEQIGDFYTALTIDRRFVMLEDGKWDLKSNYTAEVEEDDEEDHETSSEIIEIDEEIEEEEPEEDDDDIEEAIDDDIEEDELSDLVVINEEDLED